MAKVNQVDKRVLMAKWDIVKYQILTHCYIAQIQISDADLNLLTLLAMEGDQELTSFCNKAADAQIFKSPQSARNALIKIETKGLISKQGKSKKKLVIDPQLNVQSRGNVLLEYKFLAVETA